MKFTILVFLSILATAHAAPKRKALPAPPVVAVAAPADNKPILKDGMVCRTLQQDAELKDWIIGLQKENQENGVRADNAEKSEVTLRTFLQAATGKADTLQTNVTNVTNWGNEQAGLKDQALDTVDKQALVIKAKDARINKLSRIIAAAVAIIVLLGMVAAKVWMLFPPYGMIAMIVVPLGVFGAVFLWGAKFL